MPDVDVYSICYIGLYCVTCLLLSR